MVKKGFKQTEIGVIPESWRLCTIKNLIEEELIAKPLDGNHGNIHPKKTDYVDYGIPFVMANNIIGSKISYAQCNYLKKEQADSLQKGFSYEGDVLLTHKGTVGNVALVERISSPYLMLTPQVTYYRTLDDDKLDRRYIKAFFESELFQQQLLSQSGGGTRAYVGITSQALLKFILPPPCEQKAIATALTDIDNLIQSLETLIAKKRDIKTATMQQLLTEKKRLPGFGEGKGTKQTELGEIPEDWDVDIVGNLLSITTGDKNTQDKKDDGQYPFFVRSQKVEKINSFSFHGEGVLTAGDGVGTGKIFHYVDGKFDFHQRVYLMYSFSDRLYGRYFYIYFSQFFFDRIMSMTAKSSVDSVRREMIFDMKIFLPSFDEQKRIASTLFDMDSEIEQLTLRLNKTHLIKQGMMQELLTGRTRLIDMPEVKSKSPQKQAQMA